MVHAGRPPTVGVKSESEMPSDGEIEVMRLKSSSCHRWSLILPDATVYESTIQNPNMLLFLGALYGELTSAEVWCELLL